MNFVILCICFCIILIYFNEKKKQREIAEEKQSIKNFINSLNGIINTRTQEFLIQHEKEIDKKINGFYKRLDSLTKNYVCMSEKYKFIDRGKRLCDEVRNMNVPESELLSRVERLYSVCDFLEEWIDFCNEEFIKNEKVRCNALLSNIDGKSLDDQQGDVVVTDEDNTLVLAGAGSGKTLTISGKTKYLCDIKHVNPEDILLISFGRDAAKEMSKRVREKLNIKVGVRTFHSLGLGIIKKADKKQPLVEKNPKKYFNQFFIDNIHSDPTLIEAIIKYFAFYIDIPANLEDFSTAGECYEYNKMFELESLKNKYLTKEEYINKKVSATKPDKLSIDERRFRSKEEVMIANYLFLNGVNYEYERKYPYSEFIYRPDFYLPDYDIYLEHFGITKDNKAPWLSEIEEEKYISDKIKKEQLHKEKGTVLLETYSYYFKEGNIYQKLEEILKEHGVKLKPLKYEEIFSVLYDKKNIPKAYSDFIDLCITFISLYKTNGFKEDDIPSFMMETKKEKNPFIRERTYLFLCIVFEAYAYYMKEMDKYNKLDYADMIIKAIDLLENGAKVPNYKYIIIDEYQDISYARFKLIKEILNRTGAKLLCVGDDWQSIFRFAGSDLKMFTLFDSYFEYTKEMKIEKTYRNSQELIDIMSKFIMKNKAQKEKSLLSDKRLSNPVIFYFSEQIDYSETLQKILDEIIQEFGEEKSILLLGRYNSDLEKTLSLCENAQTPFKIIEKKTKKATDIYVEYDKYPNTIIRYYTVHKSKGLEADNMVLLNFKDAITGFPSQIKNDPVLSLVLPDENNYPYEEERRLLYVALTRTKNRSYIIADLEHPSQFLNDFVGQENVKFVNQNAKKNKEKKLYCPYCQKGILQIVGTGDKAFVACSNSPQCGYTNDKSIFTETKRCPRCNNYMVKRKSKFKEGGYYWKCNRCSYTETIKNSC